MALSSIFADFVIQDEEALRILIEVIENGEKMQHDNGPREEVKYEELKGDQIKEFFEEWECPNAG